MEVRNAQRIETGKDTTYANEIVPTNLVASVAPKVSSPSTPVVSAGWKKIATRFWAMTP